MNQKQQQQPMEKTSNGKQPMKSENSSNPQVELQETKNEISQLRTYDWNELPEHFMLVLCGMRRCGKGILTNYILSQIHEKREWDAVFLFSETSSVQTDAWEYIPKKFKYDKVDYEVIEKILKRQQDIIDGGKTPPNVLLILDDCVHNSRMRYGQSGDVINKLACAGRHYKLSVMCLFQKLVGGVNPKFRENCDVMVFFRQPSRKQREFIVENYLTIKNTNKKDYIYDFLDGVFGGTQYTTLVIVVSDAQKSFNLSDFCYRHPPAPEKVPEFFIGNSIYHKL